MNSKALTYIKKDKASIVVRPANKENAIVVVKMMIGLEDTRR